MKASLRILLLLIATSLLAVAHAQMAPPVTVDSIDLKVLNARTVTVGRVVGISDSTPGKPKVTIVVDQTLKGEKQTQVEGTAPADVVRQWNLHPSTLLVFSPPGSGDLATIDLEDPGLLVSKRDFTLIRDRGRLLRYVHDVALRHPETTSGPGIMRTPPDNALGARWKEALHMRGYVGLMVPIDADLERELVREIKSDAPQGHVVYGQIERRLEDIRSLRVFKSDETIGLLKSLLTDRSYIVNLSPANANGVEERAYIVREQAYSVLRQWGVKAPPPATVERVVVLNRTGKVDLALDWTMNDLSWLTSAPRLTSLVLHPAPRSLSEAEIPVIGKLTRLRTLTLVGMGIDDARFRSFANLKALRSLTLDDNPVTDEAIPQIASYPHLTDVSLVRTGVTDAGLAQLRRLRPDLRVAPIQAVSNIVSLAQKGDVAAVRRLLDQQPQLLNWHDPVMLNDTPLHAAAGFGRYDLVKDLLDRGAEVDSVNDWGQTPLILAASGYRVDGRVVELLLARGANVNHHDRDGRTALVNQLAFGSGDLIKLLLAAGADPFQRDAENMLPIQRIVGWNDTTRFQPLTEAMALRQHPIRLVPQTGASCVHRVYRLEPSNLAGWSTQAVGELTGPLAWSVSPSGRGYLGPFGQQAVTLKLTGLPAHGNVHVDLRLFVIGSWDGNGGLGEGPDLLDVQAVGVGTLLHSTFFNNTEDIADGLPIQSFPDPYPFGFHKGYTGATEVRTLGFVEPWDGHDFHRDAVYDLAYTFAHTGSELQIVITGLTKPQGGTRSLTDDEHWGIGGVSIGAD